MRGAALKVLFLFLSGFCALVYQTMWLRELRAVFGASTLANAAVLAVFMGGLGLGGALFGRRAERSPTPLLLYAHLEIGVALSAAASPFLVDAARLAYLALGGSSALGTAGATFLRLGLSALALGAPATLMGGTFPAMARSLLGSAHASTRKPLALLYAANTLGSVVGVWASSFALIAVLGVRETLWAACALNALFAMLARVRSRSEPLEPPSEVAAMSSPRGRRRVDVLLASFVSGFAFLLLELVWARMGAPLLGGSTYSFAVVLGLALLGIAAGGLGYAFYGPAHPKPGLFAVTCALEAALLLVPFAVGDDLASFAATLRDVAGDNFGAVVVGFFVVGTILVVPAAVVAGFQFPLLLALAGDGKEGAAQDSGEVYAANTLGSICGSLAGGFGALPLLGAPTAWRVAACVLVGAGALLGLARRPRGAARSPWSAGAFAVLALAAVLLADAPGPSALWRHGGIGAARPGGRRSSWNARRAAEHARQRLLVENDGVESTIGTQVSDGWSLIVNGKSDRSTFGDRQTQIALALVPALVQGAPHTGFVIGLGTGETAGWLASVPGIEHVDVVELEPDTQRLARAAADANRHVLDNPKVSLLIGDGREKLATARKAYDVIVSQPSNPSRAGVGDYFSRNFYAAVRARLAPGGVFCQWMQTQEVEPDAVRLVVATLRAEFTSVDAFSPEPGDLLFVAREEHVPLDVARLRRQLREEPFATAWTRIFMQPGVEGFLGDAEADDAFLASWTEDLDEDDDLNTDDHPLLELSVAGSVGHGFDDPEELHRAAAAKKQVLPVLSAPVDAALIARARDRVDVVAGTAHEPPVEGAWSRGDLADAVVAAAKDPPPQGLDLAGRMMRAHVAAVASGKAGVDDAELDALSRGGFAPEVALIRVEEALTDRDLSAVPALLDAALAASDAWVHPALYRSMFARLKAAAFSPALAVDVARVLATHELPAMRAELPRLQTAALLLAGNPEKPQPWCTSLFLPLEPHPFWDERWLAERAACYAAFAPDRAAAAAGDLAAMRAHT